jgi:hypothetical protein
VLAALLAATACEPGATEGTGSSKPADRTGATSPAKPDGSASAKPGGTGGSGTGRTAVAACTRDGLAVSAAKEPADAEHARHLLITVQNTGDEKCALHRYPHARLGADARTPAPVIEESAPEPGTSVTVAPGEEAYAALLVSGGARDEYEAKSLTLTLQGPGPGGAASGPVDVPLPVDVLHADDGQRITYWTTASGHALDFITSK